MRPAALLCLRSIEILYRKTPLFRIYLYVKIGIMLNSGDVEANALTQWPIVGHSTTITLLQRTLSHAQMANEATRRNAGPRHAYLFTGARHIGKTLLAETFAKALLCTGISEDGDQTTLSVRPCNSCRSCRLTTSGNHPDLRRFQPLDKSGEADRHNGMLRVEQASDIIHEAVLSPLESQYKCFIIQDVHTANASFANKLLKTLEEPPPHVILLLTATDKSSLLPTIVSRCQLFELRPVNQTEIAAALTEKWGTSEEQAQLLSRLSNGRIGWAIEQSASGTTTEWRQEQLEILWRLIESDRVARLSYVESLVAKRSSQDIFPLIELWTVWWRDILLAQSNALDACTNIDVISEIEKFAQQISPSAVQAYIYTLKKIEGYLRHTTNMRLALDVLLLKLPALERSLRTSN